MATRNDINASDCENERSTAGDVPHMAAHSEFGGRLLTSERHIGMPTTKSGKLPLPETTCDRLHRLCMYAHSDLEALLLPSRWQILCRRSCLIRESETEGRCPTTWKRPFSGTTQRGYRFPGPPLYVTPLCFCQLHENCQRLLSSTPLIMTVKLGI